MDRTRFPDYRVTFHELKSELATGRLFTVPNAIVVFRLGLLIPLPSLLSMRTLAANVLVVGVIVVAELVDALDGWLARRMDQVTAWGKLLDPGVDKIFQIAVLVLLHFYRGFPAWAVWFVIIRSVVVILAVAYLVQAHRHIPAPRVWGSVPNLLIGLAAALYVFELYRIGLVVLIGSVVLAIVHFLDYARRTNWFAPEPDRARML